jgi:hypothetical protein
VEFGSAVKAVNRILDQERREPTVAYSPVAANELAEAFAAAVIVPNRRKRRPREIQRDPNRFIFKSKNYDLLASVFSSVPIEHQMGLAVVMAARIHTDATHKSMRSHYPQLNWFVSELPLVAEFLVRRHFQSVLFDALTDAKPSIAVFLLLLQVEEMLDFNFNLFTDEELNRLSTSTGIIRSRLPAWRDGIQAFGRESVEICNSIQDGCRKAQYLYTAAELETGINVEINQDKQAVEIYLQKLGFAEALASSLEHTEQLYRSAASPFDWKGCMGHLRSFLENLHVEAAQRIFGKRGGTAPPARWGDSTKYLCDQKLLTEKEHQFAVHFYALISDTGVHPLIAERDYARLSRNMVIEYGLLLLSKLEKI